MKQRQSGVLLLVTVAMSALVFCAGCGDRGGAAGGPEKTQSQIDEGAQKRVSDMKNQGAKQAPSGPAGAPAYAPRGAPVNVPR